MKEWLLIIIIGAAAWFFAGFVALICMDYKQFKKNRLNRKRPPIKSTEQTAQDNGIEIREIK